jgi:hypothetical protein
VKINSALGNLGDVTDFTISADGKWVAYRADPVGMFAIGNDVFRLYSVPVGGPSSDRLIRSGTLVLHADVEPYPGYAFSPDGTRLVFRADLDTDGVVELYVSYDRPTATQRWETYR